MCGIAVAVDLTGADRATPWALDSLRHRGPDGEGVFQDGGRAALEHCRLAIIDPDNRAADQPFVDASGRWVLSYNGEIFNFRELRAEFEAAGETFRTDSDTEVLLCGFIRERERVLSRLRGMFAFVVWDRETGELFAARDQIGVKPLYYLVEDGVFLAASEVRPLLRHPRVTPRWDDEGVVEFLAFGLSPGERTVVAGLRKLLPGHYLRVRAGVVSIHEYWDVFGASLPAGDRAAELREQLRTAVAAATVSDVPIAVMLSGGLDSSVVAALAAAEVGPEALTAYSIAFGQADDEAGAAARFARDLGIRHRTLSLGRQDVVHEFESWLDTLDYPTANPTWIASSLIARAANADGIKVLLGGDGGDELFGGYNRWMRYLQIHDRLWRRIPRPLRRVSGLATKRLARGLSGDIARRAAEGGELYVPSRPFHDDDLASSLGPRGRAAAASRPPETYVAELRERLRERRPTADYLTWMSYASMKTHLVEDFLQRLDKMGMRYAVEGRVPLLDPILVRWSFGVSQREKIGEYRQKALFREAVAPLLPRYVLERPKQGFSAPVGAWSQELLHRQAPADSSLLREGIVRRDALPRLRRDGSFAGWTLAVLLAWAERNVG